MAALNWDSVSINRTGKEKERERERERVTCLICFISLFLIMVSVNCLFNFDGVNHRLEVSSKNEKNVITFEELRRNLRGHPKLKSVDFFDSQKYVIEIFDKEFDEYIKLPRDASIPDFSKLRAREKPKATTSVAKKDTESLKRPLSMYSEINIEEEHAAKILRGSPPPVNRPIPHSPLLTNTNLRRSHPPNVEPQRAETSNKSQTNIKTSVTSKPTSTTSTSKTLVASKTAALPKAPVSSKTPLPSRSPRVDKSNPDFIPLSSSSNSDLSKPPSSHGNGSSLDTTDSEKLILARAVAKYNDEFTDIMLFDDIWETDNVWSFVFRQISGQGVKDIKSVEQTRQVFKKLVDKYIGLLKNPSLTEKEARETWPLFDFFHTGLNVRPFYGRIQALKDAFAKNVGKSNGNLQQIKEEVTQSPVSSHSITDPVPIPKPQRTTTKSSLSEDVIVLSSSNDTERAESVMECEEPEIEETVTNASSQPTVSSSSSVNSVPLTITSEDFRLLLAVEDHNKEFYEETIPEYSVWREVTDQINLYKPFEPSLVMKYKTRFYQLLQEFLRLENSSIPVAEKAQWKLYSSFINIDITPFESKINES